MPHVSKVVCAGDDQYGAIEAAEIARGAQDARGEEVTLATGSGWATVATLTWADLVTWAASTPTIRGLRFDLCVSSDNTLDLVGLHATIARYGAELADLWLTAEDSTADVASHVETVSWAVTLTSAETDIAVRLTCDTDNTGDDAYLELQVQQHATESRSVWCDVYLDRMRTGVVPT